jgi:hypothetical protein
MLHYTEADPNWWQSMTYFYRRKTWSQLKPLMNRQLASPSFAHHSYFLPSPGKGSLEQV